MIAEVSLVELIAQKLARGDVELPVFDNVAQRVYNAARENKLNADGICRLLEEDPILVSDVLRLANSSFFAGLGEVHQLRQAIVRLGARQTGSLVLAASQKRMYSASKGPFKNRLVKLWEHSSAAAAGARWLARATGHSDISEECFIAALLHDIGKVSLLRIIEDLHASEGIPLTTALVDMTLDQLYCSHGAQLLQNWNLPELFRDVITKQNIPEVDDSNATLVIVRLVDMACAKEGISDRPDPTLCLESTLEANILGINEIMLAELQVVIEDAANVKEAA